MPNAETRVLFYFISLLVFSFFLTDCVYDMITLQEEQKKGVGGCMAKKKKTGRIE